VSKDSLAARFRQPEQRTALVQSARVLSTPVERPHGALDRRRSEPVSSMTVFSTQPSRAEPLPPHPDRSIDSQRRLAFWVFVAAQALIFVALLWTFRGRWFIADEWDFLAARTGGNLDSLFRPHNEHWSTLPILYYRLLWTAVGIRSYLPYLVSVLVLHITVSSLLRVTMIRSDVTPWIATLAALVISLFGAGNADIEYAFNIGFDGSIAFGLIYLIAVDHAGPANRRDALGMVAGLAALMCSGIGVSMVFAVGLALWLRHGHRRALMHVLPLAGVYLVWFAAIGHTAYSRYSSLPELIRFAARGLAFTFSSLGHSPLVGSALVVLLVAGTIVALRSDADERWSHYSVPFALMVGAVVFMVLTGAGRASASAPSSATYGASRYLYVVAVMVMPAMAVAASQLIVHWRLLAPVVLAILVLGVPGNIGLLVNTNYSAALDSYRQLILSIPRLPVAGRIPPSVRPDPYFDPWVTVGWLLDGVRTGRIPPPSPPPSQAQIASWTLRLAWYPASAAGGGTCRPVALPAVLQVESGTHMTSDAPVEVTYLYRPNAQTLPIRLSRSFEAKTYESFWPMKVRLSPTRVGQQPVTVCAGHRTAAG
jgi:hypothetical protein